MTTKVYKFKRKLIDKNGIARFYHMKPSNYKTKYSYDKNKRGAIKKILEDVIYRSSIVMNFDNIKKKSKSETPKGNVGEFRAIYWSEKPINPEVQKNLRITVYNMNTKTIRWQKKLNDTKLTIGTENEKVSRTEMRQGDQLDYCNKYMRFKLGGDRPYEAELNDLEVEEEMKKRDMAISKYGFVMNPQRRLKK